MRATAAKAMSKPEHHVGGEEAVVQVNQAGGTGDVGSERRALEIGCPSA